MELVILTISYSVIPFLNEKLGWIPLMYLDNPDWILIRINQPTNDGIHNLFQLSFD